MPHRAPLDVWNRGLDNHFKTVTKETGDERNVVLTENASNFIEFKEINQTKQLSKVVISRSLINRICKPQGTFFGHMIRRENRTSCDNWNDRR